MGLNLAELSIVPQKIIPDFDQIFKFWILFLEVIKIGQKIKKWNIFKNCKEFDLKFGCGLDTLIIFRGKDMLKI